MTSYTFTERKRPRCSFSKNSHTATIPSLLRLQQESYRWFLQQEVPPEKRKDVGLQSAFKAIFPIYSTSGLIYLEFDHYELSEPLYDVQDCKERGLTYAAMVYVHIHIVIKDKKEGDSIRDIKEERVYMGNLPMMTENGSFIINGTERVVVSQLHRSPGVFFEHDSGRGTLSNKYLYSARIIPYSGRWLDFEFDQRDIVYFRVDRRRKMPVTILLKAIGYTEEQILAAFYDFDVFAVGAGDDEVKYLLDAEFLHNATLPFDIQTPVETVSLSGKTPLIGARLVGDVYDEKGNQVATSGSEITSPLFAKMRTAKVKTISVRRLLIAKNQRIKKSDLKKIEKLDKNFYAVDDSFLEEKRLAHDIFDGGGELIAKANAEITPELIARIRAARITEIKTLHINELNRGPYISQTLLLDERLDQDAARSAIYRMLRPGDPPSKDVVNAYLDNAFFNSDTYNLSEVGRMKFNSRLDSSRPAMEYRIWIPKEAVLSKTDKQKTAERLVLSGCLSDIDLALDFVEYIAQYGDRSSGRSVIENLSKQSAEHYSQMLEKEGVKHEVLEQVTLSREDILSVVQKLVSLRNGKGKTDDIDSLANRRVRMVGEFVANYFQQGLLRVDRAIRDRLSRAEQEKLMPHDLISAKAISSSVAEFFNGNQLSQFMDQTNPLSEVTHKRRVSAFGAGGLTRDRVGFEVRDVHPTHYGRVCPIETPEGQNIGLINSMALFSNVNSYGFLQTQYLKVEEGRVTGESVYLSAIEEEGKIIIQANSPRDAQGKLVDSLISARKDGEYIMVTPQQVDYVDISPAQIASVAASMIPFLEHDDANRALMGSNMQRQAVPCLCSEKPLVGTGVERKVASDSGTVVRVARSGTVCYVDSDQVVVSVDEEEVIQSQPTGVDIYNLVKHIRSNQNTDINQRPIVHVGDKVKKGDVIADGSGTDFGELSLGQNLLVAFLPWNGYNFEDSILISDQVVAQERYTSIHVIEEVVHARSTQLGDEEITRDIQYQSEVALRNLDDEGIVRVGVEVHPGDILVGKVTPKGERQLAPEEKLLQAVFGEKANDYKDTSLRMPLGSSGVVIDVKVFTSEETRKKDKKKSNVGTSKRADAINEQALHDYEKKQMSELDFICEDAVVRIRKLLGSARIAGADKMKPTQWFEQRTKNEATNAKIEAIVKVVKEQESLRKKRIKGMQKKLVEGHDLPQGILKTVKVYIAIKRHLQVGDKMAGRHGNKGVVSKVEPVESMPYLADGTTVDIVLNPLGVPSRMNVGQILETHLGFAAKGLGKKLESLLLQEKGKQVTQVRDFLEKVYADDKTFSIKDLSDNEVIEIAKNLTSGVPFATPIFDGAAESQIGRMLELADLPKTGQVSLYDGRSGEPFDRSVTVGYMYIMKLHHLVDDKMHSRSTGPYSLVTRQPLGGKAQGGGQRFGEMEVWALEAYGASYALCEMLTVKSDDVAGRVKMFENITEGDLRLRNGVPESFNVLVQEVRAMGMDMDIE